MAGRYRVEHVRETPRGWKVRTVSEGRHRVRVAFPPGARHKGDGVVVEILHPAHESNPCPNPAELVLIGGNPLGRSSNGGASSAYNSLSRTEKLAFGRLGLGKRQLQNASDIEKARRKVADVERFRNHLPNPSGVSSEESEEARELAAEFKHAPSDTYFVMDEPHVPAGNYARLGDFLGIAIKPEKGGQVQELSFGTKCLLIASADQRQLYVVGTQELEPAELVLFTDAGGDPILLGEGRGIVYRATKWHPQIPDNYRGKDLSYEHHFGEEGGRKPQVWYSPGMRRLLLKGGDYRVEGVGIVN